jgi:beta-glucosidase
MLTEEPLTEASLEIWPHRIRDLVMQIRREYSRPTPEVNESGCSYLSAPWEKTNGHVPDIRRIGFFRDELAELAHAIADGANVSAFHAWSLLDSFEWADG